MNVINVNLSLSPTPSLALSSFIKKDKEKVVEINSHTRDLSPKKIQH